MKQLLFLACLWCSSGFADAEILIHGKLINEKREPIAFANIGILNTSVGTTSLADGTFKIIVPDHLKDQDMIFTSLGYERKYIPVSELIQRQPTEIVLKEQVLFLEEVTVKESKRKIKTALVGPNPTGNEQFHFGSSTQKGGAVVAVLLDPKPSAYALKNVRINIAGNTWTEAKFRIRLFSVNDSTSLPQDDLIQKNIMTDCTIEEGWLIVDLEPYAIYLDEDRFFLGVELIEDPKIKQLQHIEDSIRRVHYRKLYERGEKGIEIVTTTNEEGKEVTNYFAKNKGVQSLTKSLDEAGVIPSPRTNFKISSRMVSKYPCYTRRASFDKWQIRPFTLVAKILLEYEK